MTFIDLNFIWYNEFKKCFNNKVYCINEFYFHTFNEFDHWANKQTLLTNKIIC